MKLYGLVAGAVVSLAATSAHACPSCATREGPGWSTLALIFGMIAVPYVVATVAVRAVRKLDAGEAGDQ